MSKIIGISSSGHDVGCSLIVDGNIIFALEEEKLTGIKSCNNQGIFPQKTLELIATKFNINLFNCDYISVARSKHYSFKNFPEKYQVENIRNKITSVSHHKCHNMGAYYTSGMNGKVISLSLDGSGVRSRGKIYLCDDGKTDLIHSEWAAISSSLANIWGFSVNYMGWKILKDEGKLVGLAGHGKVNKKIYEYLNMCHYYENLSFKGSGWLSMFIFICNKLKQDSWFTDENKRADYAATLQKFSEDNIYKLLFDIKKQYPEYTKLCLSGGLFANVKLNQFINESNLYDEIFIHQAMGDSGLALGAAICKSVELNEIITPLKPKTVYFGESFTKHDWELLLKMPEYMDVSCEILNISKVASLINNGNVLGIFIGKTEYGPRALGNRSIVVRPTDIETHKKLNKRLNRNEIMPFAPSVLEEYADEIFYCKKSKYTAEFMTLCYQTKDEWIDKIPAVVHYIDKSSRPHIVKKEVNELYYTIIDEYRKISGIPVVLNTSFNTHGTPINNYPKQVMQHLLDKSVDYIITEDFILTLLIKK